MKTFCSICILIFFFFFIFLFFFLSFRILDSIYTMHMCHGMEIGIVIFVLSFCAVKCTLNKITFSCKNIVSNIEVFMQLHFHANILFLI